MNSMYFIICVCDFLFFFLHEHPYVIFSFIHFHFPEQVKVMVRICPSVGVQDSSESMSFLKVDQRKKQLTLYEPSLLTQPSSGHRRTPLAAPKMFAFDAIFTQDASQVKAPLDSM